MCYSVNNFQLPYCVCGAQSRACLISELGNKHISIFTKGYIFFRHLCTFLINTTTELELMSNINLHQIQNVFTKGARYAEFPQVRSWAVLPGAGCSQRSRPVWQQRLCAGQRHGDERQGQQVVVPVQLRQGVHEARQGELCLPGVVIEWNLWGIRPQVDTSPRIPKGQGLFARRYVKTHEQLAHRVDMKNVCHVSQTSGLTELALTWERRWNMCQWLKYVSLMPKGKFICHNKGHESHFLQAHQQQNLIRPHPSPTDTCLWDNGQPRGIGWNETQEEGVHVHLKWRHSAHHSEVIHHEETIARKPVQASAGEPACSQKVPVNIKVWKAARERVKLVLHLESTQVP